MALVALLFSLVFFHPVLSPLSPSPSHVAVRGPPGENSDDHALRCVFFLSFLPSSFPPPFLTPCFFPSFFFPLFFLLSAGIAAGVPVFVYRRNSMYILYARTPDQPLSCMACTFVRPDVRIVINTTLAFRTMRHASLCLAHVPPRDSARPGPLIKFVSPNVHRVIRRLFSHPFPPCLCPLPRVLRFFLPFFLQLRAHPRSDRPRD